MDELITTKLAKCANKINSQFWFHADFKDHVFVQVKKKIFWGKKHFKSKFSLKIKGLA